MQTSISNIDIFISKINHYAIFIISFLKTIFNNIIAIKDCSFDNLLNSTGIIMSFVLSIFNILVFITLLCFLGSIFKIIKTIIKCFLEPFKLLFKFIKWIFSPKSPKGTL
uniref:Uncharacterized protein n=1 Tax=Onion yellows phytoplasma TaxID=100379 RepID=B9A9N9_ONYPH|nr:hypothetical protein [Onion yellows phytoplasma]BAH22367.1 hypothetical protein [Onion yellows phytoplasma]